jgi:hydroxymethylbilane synthase
MATTLRIGTRQSPLALQQTHEVIALLKRAWPTVHVEVVGFRTTGDRIQDVPLTQIGAKGLFVTEIEEALLEGRIDWAVHSVKDLPSQLPTGLCLGVVAARQDPRDALVARRGLTLATLPEGAVIGTSSLRRRAQLLHWRPDLRIVPLRGNLDTRLRKLEAGNLDGIVVAAAGLLRMGWAGRISELIPPELCLPAVGQGALGVEMRRDDAAAQALFAPLGAPATQAAITAERCFLAHLQGSCQVPIAALATVDGEDLRLRGMIGSVDGCTVLRGERRGALATPERVGAALAEDLLQGGGDALLRGLPRAGRLPKLEER